MTKWQCLVLGGQCEKITKGTTPTSIGGSFVDHGINFVKVESITQQGSIDKPNLAAIDDETHTLLKRSRLAKGDILFSIAGTIGRSCIVDETLLPANTNQAVAIIRLKEHSSLDLRFLYYQLRSEVIAQSVREGVVQAVQANFSLGQLKKLTICAPSSIHEQREIASILGTLDDKIENNRKTAATLEEMARALYRSWFVDFDPVHAKAAGEKPAFMDEQTAALFPDRFGDDGLPEGWRDSCLSDIATFLNGVALQKYPPAEGDQGFPAIKIAELRNGLSKNTGRASSHIPEKYQVNNGDVLFSWSGSLLQRVWTEDAGALNQHLFKVSSTAVPRWFHYFAVDQHIPAFQEVAASKATTMGHIQRHHLDEAEVTVPDECVLQLADSLIGPIFAKAIALELESRTLAEVRDTLLPKLMSGEIRVGEAREQVEELT